MFAKLKFQEGALLWLYIPAVKDIKEKKEHSGLRPFLLTSTKKGYYEFATMTEHFKNPNHQYRIQYEANQTYQHRPINFNTKVRLQENVLQRIMGKAFDYILPYNLNRQDFNNFKVLQKKYFADPELLGKRYKL
jgi:hypothetical protein